MLLSHSFLQDRDMCGGLNFTTAMNGTRIISLVVGLHCTAKVKGQDNAFAC